MAQSDLTRVVEPACAALAEKLHYELVDVELVREGASKYLRIYINKPDGITLSDCETYHRAVAPLVERVDYDFLEVCSPGIDRPLKKQKDYDSHVGDMVEVHLYRPVNKCKNFEGELLGLVDGAVSIRTEAGEEMSFALKEISQCKPLVVITEDDLAMDDDEPVDLSAGDDEEGDEDDDGQE